MAITNRITEAPHFLTQDHFSILTCDVCEEEITDHNSAWAAWLRGEEQIYHVHTEKGCLDYLEGTVPEGIWMTDTLINHFSALLFIIGFEKGSVEPELPDY